MLRLRGFGPVQNRRGQPEAAGDGKGQAAADGVVDEAVARRQRIDVDVDRRDGAARGVEREQLDRRVVGGDHQARAAGVEELEQGDRERRTLFRIGADTGLIEQDERRA